MLFQLAADLGGQRVGQPPRAVDIRCDPVRELLPAECVGAVRGRRRGRRDRVPAATAAPGGRQRQRGQEQTRWRAGLSRAAMVDASPRRRSGARPAQTSGGLWPTSSPMSPGLHEHRIEAGPLEGERLAPGHHVDVGDRELPGRNVGQELEHRLERVLVVVADVSVRAGRSRGRAPRARLRAPPRCERPSRSRSRARLALGAGSRPHPRRAASPCRARAAAARWPPGFRRSPDRRRGPWRPAPGPPALTPRRRPGR